MPTIEERVAGLTISVDALTQTVIDTMASGSTSQKGMVRLATNSEAQAGTAQDLAVTPAGLAVALTEGLNGVNFDTTGFARLSEANNWQKPQKTGAVSLTGATLTPDFNLGQNFTATLSANSTLANPLNQAGAVDLLGFIEIKQDATGSRTLAFGSDWKFAGGSVPTISSAANARDLLVYVVRASGLVAAFLLKDVK